MEKLEMCTLIFLAKAMPKATPKSKAICRDLNNCLRVEMPGRACLQLCLSQAGPLETSKARPRKTEQHDSHEHRRRLPKKAD